MLESLKWLGEQVDRGASDLLPIKPIGKIMGDAYIVKVIFDADENKIYTDCLKLTQGGTEEYLWVGNTATAAREKVTRLTTDNPKYLTELNNNLIINTREAANKWAQISDSKAIAELESYLSIIEDSFLKDRLDELGQRISELEGKEGLYTICIKIGGRTIELAKTEGYRELLTKVLYNPKYEKLRKGICQVCGKSGKILPDPSFESGSILKIFVTDKKGFASGVSDSDDAWEKNFGICPDCRKHLTLAWWYIKDKMVLRKIKKINAYIIPRLMVPMQVGDLDKLSEYIKNKYGAVASFEGLGEFDKALKEYAEFQATEQWYSLSVVFGAPGKADFRVEMVIQDVPATRLTLLDEKMDNFEEMGLQLFGGDKCKWGLRFADIYHIFPITTAKGEPELRPFLELLDSMLSAHSYTPEQLVYRAVQFARIQHFGSPGYNIRPSENKEYNMCIGLIKYNFLINMLEELGVFRREVELDLSTDPQKYLPEEVKEWFGRNKYGELQQALFILGYLIGEVGSAQYKKGDEKKSVLDKVDFYGMSAERVMRLSSEILGTLRIYRLLYEENERLYYCMKALLDRNLQDLRKDPLENVYYILSGYAFKTFKIIVKGGDKHE